MENCTEQFVFNSMDSQILASFVIFLHPHSNIKWIIYNTEANSVPSFIFYLFSS